MKCFRGFGLLLAFFTFFCPGAYAAGNPGRSAMECVTASRDKQDIVFSNSCNYKVFVVWCGELKYSKKRCGDGPVGNSFYTQSNNIAPGSSIRASGIQEYRYAACEGGIAFGKSEIKDSPDGSFQCIPSGSAATKKAAVEPPTILAQPRPVLQTSPVGSWQVLTHKGEKLRLSLHGDGGATYDGEFPGRWTRQGAHITVKAYVNNDFLRRSEGALTLELDIDGAGMTGVQLPHRMANVSIPQLSLTLTRMN